MTECIELVAGRGDEDRDLSTAQNGKLRRLVEESGAAFREGNLLGTLLLKLLYFNFPATERFLHGQQFEREAEWEC